MKNKKKYTVLSLGVALLFLIYVLFFVLPLPGLVLVKGEIIAKYDNSLTIIFRNSSAFWDESDIAEIGSPLKLVGVKDAERFNMGDEVVAKGYVERRGSLKISELYPSYFQPLGVDWKTTAILVFILLFLIVFYSALKRRFLLREPE